VGFFLGGVPPPLRWIWGMSHPPCPFGPFGAVPRVLASLARFARRGSPPATRFACAGAGPTTENVVGFCLGDVPSPLPLRGSPPGTRFARAGAGPTTWFVVGFFLGAYSRPNGLRAPSWHDRRTRSLLIARQRGWGPVGCHALWGFGRTDHDPPMRRVWDYRRTRRLLPSEGRHARRAQMERCRTKSGKDPPERGTSQDPG
jgi:hypothetical protein